MEPILQRGKLRLGAVTWAPRASQPNWSQAEILDCPSTHCTPLSKTLSPSVTNKPQSCHRREAKSGSGSSRGPRQHPGGENVRGCKGQGAARLNGGGRKGQEEEPSP